MAREIYRFAVTVSAGTAKAAPQTTALAMPSRLVRRIEVKVPPGPRGEVGFQFASGGVQMIPVNADQFIVTDSAELSWDLEDQIDSGAWQMIAYNTGTFDHTLEVRFLVALVPGLAVAISPALIESTALSS